MSQPPYATTDPTGAKELLDGPVTWTFIDVRTLEEFEQGHVPASCNIPIGFAAPGGVEPNHDFAGVIQTLAR